MSTVKKTGISENDFWLFHENHFVVLPDGKTLCGVDASDPRTLVSEELYNNCPFRFGRHGNWVQTLLFCSGSQTLLAGDMNGHVVQYKRSPRFYTILRDFGDIYIGNVHSSCLVGGLAVFGGTRYSLAVIDTSAQFVYEGIIRSPFEHTSSLRECAFSDSCTLLCLSGWNPEYTSGASDCLDVTRVYNYHGKQTRVKSLERSETAKLLDQKDAIIEAQKIKIQKLEKDLTSKATENQGGVNSKNSKKSWRVFCRKVLSSTPKTSNYSKSSKRAGAM